MGSFSSSVITCVISPEIGSVCLASIGHRPIFGLIGLTCALAPGAMRERPVGMRNGAAAKFNATFSNTSNASF